MLLLASRIIKEKNPWGPDTPRLSGFGRPDPGVGESAQIAEGRPIGAPEQNFAAQPQRFFRILTVKRAVYAQTVERGDDLDIARKGKGTRNPFLKADLSAVDSAAKTVGGKRLFQPGDLLQGFLRLLPLLSLLSFSPSLPFIRFSSCGEAPSGVFSSEHSMISVLQ